MHLLLFHEDAQSDSAGDVSSHRRGGDGPDIEDTPGAAAPTPTVSHARTGSMIAARMGAVRSSVSRGSSRKLDLIHGTEGTLERRQQSIHGGSGASGRSLRVSSHTTSPCSGHASSDSSRITESATGKAGRFATAGRVREFRMTLKAAATHASKMKVYCA